MNVCGLGSMLIIRTSANARNEAPPEEEGCPLHRHQEDGGPCSNCPDYTGPRDSKVLQEYAAEMWSTLDALRRSMIETDPKNPWIEHVASVLQKNEQPPAAARAPK